MFEGGKSADRGKRIRIWGEKWKIENEGEEQERKDADLENWTKLKTQPQKENSEPKDWQKQRVKENPKQTHRMLTQKWCS